MDTPHSASMAGQDTPTNEEAYSTPHAAGLRDQENNLSAEYQASTTVDASTSQQDPIPEYGSESDDALKNLASLQAWAALRGYSVEQVRGADGIDVLIATGSGKSHEMRSRDELAAFIAQAGREYQDAIPGIRLNSGLVALRRADWEKYRDQCFIRCSQEPIWIWTAAHDFEFCNIGLFLADVPGAKIDLGMKAMSIHVFDNWHVIPIARMTVKSLEHLGGVANFSTVDQRTTLLNSQQDAENVLRSLVNNRFLFKAAPGSLNGSLQ